MNTKSPITKSVVEQTASTTTSWIGHQTNNNKDIIGGQTFTSPSEVELEAIEVLTSVVAHPGNVLMTLHSFDAQLESWGPILGSVSVDFNQNDNGKWKSFNIAGLHLNEGKSYGFRLESLDSGACIGVAEAVGCNQSPLSNSGQEWQFTNNDIKGHSFSYFSLAFKVDAKAA